MYKQFKGLLKFGWLFLTGILVGLLFTQIVSTLQSRLFNVHPIKQTVRHQDASGEKITADTLFNKIRVVCMILTMPKNHETKAKHVKQTWAKRCNKHFFVSSEIDDNLPSIAAVSHEDPDFLWKKTQFAVKYAAKMFGKDYDYFLKADDDTYVIMENVRKLLLGYNSSIPFIMGRRFRPYVEQGYLSGGAAYVFSRAALHQIVHGLDHNRKCLARHNDYAEDVLMGNCAEVANVSLVDSLDEYGLERFHPFHPGTMMSANVMNRTGWILRYNYHKLVYGMNCCSDYSISFHYIKPSDLYVLDFLIYHVRPYGVYRDYNDFDHPENISHLSNRNDIKK